MCTGQSSSNSKERRSPRSTSYDTQQTWRCITGSARTLHLSALARGMAFGQEYVGYIQSNVKSNHIVKIIRNLSQLAVTCVIRDVRSLFSIPDTSSRSIAPLHRYPVLQPQS
jgi:hypothetical protein